VHVLGFGVLAVTTSEFMVSGLVVPMAADLRVDVAAIGYLISAFAAGMAVGGPLLAVGLLRLSRPRAVQVVMGLFLTGQVLAALAPSYGPVLAARVLTGAASSAFFGVAIATSADLVAAEHRARAASAVLAGLTVGTVVGLPATVLIGNAAGWRTAFWAVAGLAAVAGAAVLAVVPHGTPGPPVRLRAELAALGSRKLWTVFATSLLTIGATFAAFSYAAPILTGLGGFPAEAVPLLLAAYGVATVIGNSVGGRLADRAPVRVQAVGLTALAGVLVLFAVGASHPVLAVLGLLGVGLVGLSMNPAMAARVMRAANARPLVSTVHTAVITAGVLVGSAAGAAAIDAGWGLAAPLWVGAGLAGTGLLSLLPELRPTPATGAAASASDVEPAQDRLSRRSPRCGR
jgi:predicted MFS family arabinose efflux permease